MYGDVNYAVSKIIGQPAYLPSPLPYLFRGETDLRYQESRKSFPLFNNGNVWLLFLSPENFQSPLLGSGRVPKILTPARPERIFSGSSHPLYKLHSPNSFPARCY